MLESIKLVRQACDLVILLLVGTNPQICLYFFSLFAYVEVMLVCTEKGTNIWSP
jgi:hypothetical protein